MGPRPLLDEARWASDALSILPCEGWCCYRVQGTSTLLLPYLLSRLQCFSHRKAGQRGLKWVREPLILWSPIAKDRTAHKQKFRTRSRFVWVILPLHPDSSPSWTAVCPSPSKISVSSCFPPAKYLSFSPIQAPKSLEPRDPCFKVPDLLHILSKLPARDMIIKSDLIKL